MAIIGRRACPWCGFEHSHVKQNEGKLPYHHCPSCGTMTPAKNGHQAELLKRGMGPIDALKLPEPPATDDPIIVRGVDVTPVSLKPAEPPPAPRKPASWIDQLLGGDK